MPAIFFALISYFGWGVGDFLVAVTARRLDSYSATLWSWVLSVLLMSLYAPFVTHELSRLTITLLLFNLLLGLILLAGIILFREALRKGNASLVNTITASFTAVATVLSIIFFNEQLTALQSVSIILIFSGLVLALLSFQEIRRGKLLMRRSTFFALIAMFAWGIFAAFIKIPVREIGWFWPNYFCFMLLPLLFVFMKIRRLRIHSPTANSVLIPLVVSTVLVRIAELSYNVAINKGLTSTVAPIAGSYPTLFVVLAFIFFKDPITKQQIAGIITTLVGIVLLSFLSV